MTLLVCKTMYYHGKCLMNLQPCYNHVTLRSKREIRCMFSPLRQWLSSASSLWMFSFRFLFFSFSFSYFLFHCSAVSSRFTDAVFFMVFALREIECECVWCICEHGFGSVCVCCVTVVRTSGWIWSRRHWRLKVSSRWTWWFCSFRPESPAGSASSYCPGTARESSARQRELTEFNLWFWMGWGSLAVALVSYADAAVTHGAFGQSWYNVSQRRQRLVDVLGFIQNGSLRTCLTHLTDTQKSFFSSRN